MKKLVSIAILLAAVFAVTAQAQNNSNRVAVPLSDPSKPGLVKSNILNGSISVRTHSGKDIIVESGAIGRVGRTPEVRPDGLREISTNGRGFSIEESDNVITISSQRFTGGSIDIQVPVKTNLKLSALNGGTMIVDGVDGEIDVQNHNGDVRLNNVSGSVVAHAMNGNVFATIREVTPNKPISFSSFNANVDVTLPSATKANLKMRSDNGKVFTDFEMQVGPGAPPVTERRNGGVTFRIDNTINGTINGGGPDIEARTFNGNIYLRKAK